MKEDNIKQEFYGDKRLKYMDYVQDVINRMSNNQLVVKGAACAALIPTFLAVYQRKKPTKIWGLCALF